MHKNTKGNKKFKQYIDDVRKNVYVTKLINEYINAKDKNRKKELLTILAEKYGLDYIEVETLIFAKDKKIPYKDYTEGDYFDVCEVMNRHDEYFNKDIPHIHHNDDPYQWTHTLAYPISIDIHKLASKNDVLDFIEKKWYDIEGFLELYRKQVRRRTRKNIDITEFIWENKDLNKRLLKKLLDNKFPDNEIAYHEIYKIISTEKNRRNKNFTIGQ